MLINLAYLIDRPTGTTAYALNLLPYLAPLSPTYLATPASGFAAVPSTSVSYPSVPYIAVPDNMTQGTQGHLRRLWWTQFQLAKIYQERKAQLLFSPIPEIPLRFPWALGKTQRDRAVVTFHDLIPLRFPEMFGAIKYYYRYYVPQVLAQAEQVICNSEATARDAVDFYGIPAQKLVPIPLAYDANHFRPTAARPQLAYPARQTSQTDQPNQTDQTNQTDLGEWPYFLMLGRQSPYKNIAPVIRAMVNLPEHRLLIAGPTDPRYTPELKALVNELGLQFSTEAAMPARVQFLSYVPYDQMPALLSHAVALVFPSLWEGFGLPVLEAMACGTPVITSNVASLPEVAGDAAYLVDPTRYEDIAQAMKAVALDQQLQRQLSEAGLMRSRQFSWQKTGQATVEVLQRYL